MVDRGRPVQRHHHHRPFCDGHPLGSRSKRRSWTPSAASSMTSPTSRMRPASTFLQKLGHGGGPVVHNRSDRLSVMTGCALLYRPIATAQTGLDVDERHAVVVAAKAPAKVAGVAGASTAAGRRAPSLRTGRRACGHPLRPGCLRDEPRMGAPPQLGKERRAHVVIGMLPRMN